MASTAVLIGGAGTGKTTELLRLMSMAIEAGKYDIREIGFCSFTRAARAEAAGRAASQFDCNPKDLEQHGWFRTIHSICYKQLAVGDELLGPGVDSRNWIQESIQEPVSGSLDGPMEDAPDRVGEATDADRLLGLWSLARNRIVPFATIYDEIRASSEMSLRWSLPECIEIIGRYEQAKRLDHRCDFTDLLARFGGWSFTTAGPLEVTPQGECPSIPVLFIDEAQDNTALMDCCFRRLAENARWVYLSGDPFQAIYGWNGSDHRLFRHWPAAKTRILEQSFRCPSKILARGEECLRSCSDYWDRGIKPVAEGGDVYELAGQHEWLSQVKPSDSWLLLARTNYQARRLMGIMQGEGVPWMPIKGNGGWKRSKRRNALEALTGLEQGDVVTPANWGDVLQQIPAKAGGTELLARGIKTKWKDREPQGEHEQRFLSGLTEWGATEALVRMIGDGTWVQLVDDGEAFRSAKRQYGWEGVLDSKIRIGTIHAAKGMEADSVVVNTTTSRPVWAASESDERQSDEEKRLGYVAVTRARQRVYLWSEASRYRMECLS